MVGWKGEWWNGKGKGVMEREWWDEKGIGGMERGMIE